MEELVYHIWSYRSCHSNAILLFKIRLNLRHYLTLVLATNISDTRSGYV